MMGKPRFGRRDNMQVKGNSTPERENTDRLGFGAVFIFLRQIAPAPRGFGEAAPDRRFPAGQGLARAFCRSVPVFFRLFLCCLHEICTLKAISPESPSLVTRSQARWFQTPDIGCVSWPRSSCRQTATPLPQINACRRGNPSSDKQLRSSPTRRAARRLGFACLERAGGPRRGPKPSRPNDRCRHGARSVQGTDRHCARDP